MCGRLLCASRRPSISSRQITSLAWRRTSTRKSAFCIHPQAYRFIAKHFRRIYALLNVGTATCSVTAVSSFLCAVGRFLRAKGLRLPRVESLHRVRESRRRSGAYSHSSGAAGTKAACCAQSLVSTHANAASASKYASAIEDATPERCSRATPTSERAPQHPPERQRAEDTGSSQRAPTTTRGNAASQSNA